jgi:hypothetical protein
MGWGMGGGAEDGETRSRVTEYLVRASGISLGASGLGLVQLRHREDMHGEAAGRKRGDARRRTRLCVERRTFG